MTISACVYLLFRVLLFHASLLFLIHLCCLQLLRVWFDISFSFVFSFFWVKIISVSFSLTHPIAVQARNAVFCSALQLSVWFEAWYKRRRVWVLRHPLCWSSKLRPRLCSPVRVLISCQCVGASHPSLILLVLVFTDGVNSV